MKNDIKIDEENFSKKFVNETNEKLKLAHAELCEKIDKKLNDEYYCFVMYLSYAQGENILEDQKTMTKTITCHSQNILVTT